VLHNHPMKRSLLLSTALLAAACSSGSTGELAVADLPDIDSSAVLRHIETLASDEFEGRAPGSAGEDLTIDYLVTQFREIGLEPGNPNGSYLQQVPLVGLTPSNFTPMTVRGNGRTETFEYNTDWVGNSLRVTDSIALDRSDLVFVGYGVEAPEYNWDDFGDMDLTGKTLVMLVNDPPIRNAAGP